MAISVASSTLSQESRAPNRWIQLVAGIVAMMAIANLQYAWTLFTKPLTVSLHASLAAIQVAFAAFILAETWLVPVEGYLVDRLGPRLMIAAGGVLVGLGWIGAGMAHSVRELITYYAIGGVGAGVIYGGTIGNALKWFPDCRGLCVGMTAGAYGIGTALTIVPIARMIKSSGYAHTFVTWGIIQGLVVLVAAVFIAKPPAGWSPPGWKEKETQQRKVRIAAVDLTPGQMLRHGSFYAIYLMMTMVAFSGLVVTAQLAPIARFYHVDTVVVAFGMSALVLAIEVDRILKWAYAAFLGMGVGPYRPRKHHVYRLCLPVARGFWVVAAYLPPRLVHPDVGLHLLRLGRDILPVPGHHRGPVWQNLGHNELWRCVYGQGRGLDLRRTGGGPGEPQDRLLDPGLLGHDRLQYGGCLHGHPVAQAAGSTHHQKRGDNGVGDARGGGESSGSSRRGIGWRCPPSLPSAGLFYRKASASFCAQIRVGMLRSATLGADAKAASAGDPACLSMGVEKGYTCRGNVLAPLCQSPRIAGNSFCGAALGIAVRLLQRRFA